ncbi:MAG: YciI family protein [Burkholderiales bacterium]|nr:YciI family protein [Burkholderiales bacterium]
MLFVIFCLDRAGTEEKRKQAIQAHMDYLATKPIKVVMSGPLTTDGGDRAIGSLFLVEATGRGEVEAFQRGDPFYNAGIWDMVEVRAFNKRVG